jgi:CheY-like chemotaxis protein
MSKLILIDDEAVFHKIVQMTLRNTRLSGEATYSYDGEVILDYLEEHGTESQVLPDYIFIDLYMPHFNGWDFLNRFQKIYQSLKKKINVYVVSSSIDPKDIEQSKKYPFVTTFISKPLMREVFDSIEYA